MHVIGRPGRFVSAIAGLGVVLLGALLMSLASPAETQAAWPWTWGRHKPVCGHPGCTRDKCLTPDGWAGQWYWMRSPDQERRVVMGLFNRYCIRCHGVDGRGVWDIPDVPDFTDKRWQASRPDPQIVNIVMEGRGACMPMFRGTLSLDEAWAMAHYLRTFVPGSEVARPDVGRSGAAATDALPPLPATDGAFKPPR
jgi:mono/diheme cytochrome c family protein